MSFLKICLRWAGPRPHIPFPSRPHFVCKFSRHGYNLSVLRPGSPSITILVLPDFAMHIVAQLLPIDLHNFQAKYQRVVSFWVPVNYPSLNELDAGTTMYTYSVSLTPNLCHCKLPYCNDSALSWPFSHPLRVEENSEFHSKPETFGLMSPHCRFSDLGPFRRWIKSIRNQHVKCNERRTRTCHRAYYIGGATPFHSCMIVRSPKLVSSEDRTGSRAPSASYCSTEGVAPLHKPPVPVHTAPPVLVHTAPPVPVHTAPPVPDTLRLMFMKNIFYCCNL